jgi:hypothetical protein
MTGDFEMPLYLTIQGPRKTTIYQLSKEDPGPNQSRWRLKKSSTVEHFVVVTVKGHAICDCQASHFQSHRVCKHRRAMREVGLI